jgi:hypothetical protein
MMEKTNGEIEERLDTIIALLQLAYREQIEKARSEILSDPVSAAILEATSDQQVDAGTLQDQVAATTKQSKRTIQRRLAALVGQRVIVQSGSGPHVRYRRTELI